jgi:formate hydrogenlyase subunit 6/NADH:ubiquinone oxidoreductase subunit I
LHEAKDVACVDACPVDCVHPKKNPTYDDGPAENHTASDMFAIQA